MAIKQTRYSPNRETRYERLGVMRGTLCLETDSRDRSTVSLNFEVSTALSDPLGDVLRATRPFLLSNARHVTALEVQNSLLLLLGKGPNILSCTQACKTDVPRLELAILL